MLTKVQSKAKIGVQGLVSLGPLFSVFSAGTVILVWNNRRMFEKRLIDETKRQLVKHGVSLSDEEVLKIIR